MTFVPPPDVWLSSHFIDVPAKTIAACGSLVQKTILDVGCGDMLSDFGLLAQGARQITGLDLVESVDLQSTWRRLNEAGLQPPADYADHLSYLGYNGTDFPVGSESCDIVFSWGAFEHIANPLAVLTEMKRVCRRDGLIYIVVYPWWPCFYGSHLTDYIPEPFFHLKREPAWVRTQLDAYIATHPAEGPVIDHVYSQYLTLNHCSAAQFAEDVRRADLQVKWCSVIAYPQSLEGLPESTPVTDAMICGTEMVITR